MLNYQPESSLHEEMDVDPPRTNHACLAARHWLTLHDGIRSGPKVLIEGVGSVLHERFLDIATHFQIQSPELFTPQRFIRWLSQQANLPPRSGGWNNYYGVFRSSLDALGQTSAVRPYSIALNDWWDNQQDGQQLYNLVTAIEAYGRAPIVNPPIYPAPDANEETSLHNNDYQKIIAGLETRKCVMFLGPPGCGKSFVAQEIAKILTGDNAEHIKSIQFHPNYRYEDFMIGLSPCVNAADGIQKVVALFDTFRPPENITQRHIIANMFDFVTPTPANAVVQDRQVVERDENRQLLERIQTSSTFFKTKVGTLVDIAADAVAAAANAAANTAIPKFVLIIDEINRGRVTEIFGEAMTLLEVSNREARRIQLPMKLDTSEDPKFAVFANGFYIPENLYIIGTMNTVDVDTGSYGGVDDTVSAAFLRRTAQFDFVLNNRTEDGNDNLVPINIYGDDNGIDLTEMTRTDNEHQLTSDISVYCMLKNFLINYFLSPDGHPRLNALQKQRLLQIPFEFLLKLHHFIVDPNDNLNYDDDKWDYGLVGPSIFMEIRDLQNPGYDNVINHWKMSWNQSVVAIIRKIAPHVATRPISNLRRKLQWTRFAELETNGLRRINVNV